MDIGRSLRKMVIIAGMSLLGAVVGVVAGVFIGTMPGFSGSSSGGWDGIGTALGLVFLAGGLGLLGLVGGAWQGGGGLLPGKRVAKQIGLKAGSVWRSIPS